MDCNQIRQIYLDFFRAKGHEIVASAPLINRDDPTLMFINAGMNQFKDIFTGNKPIVFPRIADTQKCLRVSGKHNDLDEVGHDTYHHTLFEMLGNWSFGDYFRAEAIAWAWELLTEVYKIDKERLYVTVFEGEAATGLPCDDETIAEWKKWIPEDRILKFTKKDNFWEMGDTGPCGPCTELHIDLRTDAERQQVPGAQIVNKGDPRVIEIWNIVLIQYNRKQDGSLETLAMKSVDTGMGFERLCLVLQGKTSTYDTDVFAPTLKHLEQQFGCQYGRTEMESIAMRVAVDHIRAISFSIADGQLPGNNGAGYVIRRILRRASRYGFQYLNIKRPYLYTLVDILAEQFRNVFPELYQQKDFVRQVIEQEEKGFIQKLERGNELFEKYISTNPAANQTIDGNFAFELYDTFGFPVDLTEVMAREIGWHLDKAGFEANMEQQRQRSRQAAEVQTGDWITVSPGINQGQEIRFIGNEQLDAPVQILKYRTVKTNKGVQHHIVLNQTPFYAESGGQIGDTGTLTNAHESIQVLDTVKEHDLIVHICDRIPTEEQYRAQVDADRRRKIRANHSATHLLHAALRQVLGTHVEQRGSLVSPDYLRFDFSHFQKLSPEELIQIEDIVNRHIVAALPLVEMREVPIAEAKALGAMALFGEKYGDKVRVIRFGDNYSTELCGGTHVANTIEIRYFKIITESSIAAGVRRIEAVSSDGALDFLEAKSINLEKIATLFKHPQNLEKAIQDHVEKHKALEAKYEQLRQLQLLQLRDKLLTQCKNVGDYAYVTEQVAVESAEELKHLAFELRKSTDNAIFVLGAVIDNKPNLTVMLSDSLVSRFNAIQLIKSISSAIQGGGGGQPFYATAGGKKADGIAEALRLAEGLLTNPN